MYQSSRGFNHGLFFGRKSCAASWTQCFRSRPLASKGVGILGSWFWGTTTDIWLYHGIPWFTPTNMVFCEGFLSHGGTPKNHPKGTQCMICEEQMRGGSQWFITPQHTSSQQTQVSISGYKNHLSLAQTLGHLFLFLTYSPWSQKTRYAMIHPHDN